MRKKQKEMEQKIPTQKIIEETFSIISNHDKNGCAGFCTFKRLVHKVTTGDQTGDPGKISFRVDQLMAGRKLMTVESLQEIKGHNSKAHRKILADEKYAEIPLIIISHEGKKWLLDGHHRLNFWINRGDLSKELNVNFHWICACTGDVDSRSPTAAIAKRGFLIWDRFPGFLKLKNMRYLKIISNVMEKARSGDTAFQVKHMEGDKNGAPKKIRVSLGETPVQHFGLFLAALHPPDERRRFKAHRNFCQEGDL